VSYFLKQILKAKKREVQAFKQQVDKKLLHEGISVLGNTRGFAEWLRSDGDTNIIAEIKKASPSKGQIARDFDPLRLARAFERGGAVALSIVTDREFFQGDGGHIHFVKNYVRLPVLRKDFIIDEIQLHESRLMGADAVLLIARLLSLRQLKQFISVTHELGMDSLVEVHDADDLKKTLEADAQIIGINNRDLRDFSVSLRPSLELAPRVPEDRIKVSESGISSREDVRRLQSVGFRVFLVGEVLMAAPNPLAKLQELRGGVRLPPLDEY